jgi:hypothetical protein
VESGEHEVLEHGVRSAAYKEYYLTHYYFVLNCEDRAIFPMLFASYAIVIMLLDKSVMQCDWPGVFPADREPKSLTVDETQANEGRQSQNPNILWWIG